MLKKIYRLKKKTAFTATYKQKKIVADNFLVLYVGKEKTDFSKSSRFAFVVSKKYHKRAVKRNRIKRLMRESIRLILKTSEYNKLNQYQSFIFMPKQSCIGASFSQIDESVKCLINKL